MLGKTLSNAVTAIHTIVQTPAAICAQSVLSAATLAVQGYVDVEIDGRVFPCSNFFVTVGRSGERKSAADKIALSPHSKRQETLLKIYHSEMVDYEADFAAWKKSHEEILRKGKTREDKKNALLELGAKPEAPLFPMLSTEEPSFEGLVKTLAYGWPSMGIFSDEGGRFLVQ